MLVVVAVAFIVVAELVQERTALPSAVLLVVVGLV